MLTRSRHLGVENSAALNELSTDIRDLSSKFYTDIQAERRATLESISNSGSAILALSRTTSDRLKDVQSSTSDISAKLNFLLDVLSSGSSALGSRHDNCSINNSKSGESSSHQGNDEHQACEKPCREVTDRSMYTLFTADARKEDNQAEGSDGEASMLRIPGKMRWNLILCLESPAAPLTIKTIIDLID